MIGRQRLVGLAGVLVGFAGVMVSVAPGVGQDMRFGAQIRPRFEFRDPVNGESEGFTSMRVRATMMGALEGDIRLFVQVQDVRLWGEETSTLQDFSADNFDLHQGYIELQKATEGALLARVGRQEATYGGERLIGTVGWTQQGRAFDGILVGVGAGRARINLFGFKLSEAMAPGITADAEFAGTYSVIDAGEGRTLDVFGLYNRMDTDPGTEQVTLGARLVGQQAAVTYRGEVSYQLGDRNGSDVSAFMIGLRAGTAVAGGAGRVTLWYDYLSGDDDPTDNDVKVFDTLFATNHKFYGFADLFLDIPLQTGGLGLQDIAAKGTYTPRADLRLNLDLHSFHLARRGALESRHLGEEVDLTATYRYAPGLTVTGGWSHVFDGSALRVLGRLTQDMTFFYVMLNAAL